MKISFSKKIMLSTSLIVLFLAILISIASWILSARSFYTVERDLLSKNVENANARLTDLLETAQSLSTRVVQADELRFLMNAEDPYEAPYNLSASQLRHNIYNLIPFGEPGQSSSVYFLSIFLKNGYSLSSLTDTRPPYQGYDDCLESLLSSGITDISGYLPTIWFDRVTTLGSTSVPYLIGFRFLYKDVSLEKTGVIVMGIQQNALQDILRSVPGGMYLIRDDGTILAASDPKEIGTTLACSDELVSYAKNGMNSAVASLSEGSEAFVYRVAGGHSWTVFPIEQNSLLHSGTFLHYMYRIFLIIALGVLAAILLSFVLSRRLTRSLRSLTGTVRRIRDGHLEERVTTASADEIGYLADNINGMLDQINEFYRTREKDAEEKQFLSLQLLQSQINPHLLYNTLNSACWIIRQNDNEKAEQLILSLGNFFKLALSRGSEEIPLENEISMIRYYLRIQNLGRGKDYVIETDIPETLRQQKILRLSLQPVVENAVIHGFSDWRDDGKISVSAVRSADSAFFSVIIEDNGIGILPEDLAQLREALSGSEETSPAAHYGLINVVRRMRNRYGISCGVTAIESEVGVFSRFVLTFPYHDSGKPAAPNGDAKDPEPSEDTDRE